MSRYVNGLILLVFATLWMSFAAVEPSYDGFTLKLYRFGGLFLHGSDWVFDPRTESKSGWVRWLAIVAPLVSVVAIATLFLDWASLWWRIVARARLLFGKKCIALIGLTDQSLALARSICADSSRDTMPIVLADDPDPNFAAECALHGVAVFSLHRPTLWAWVLGSAHKTTPEITGVLKRVWGLISFLPTADDQLDFITELQSWTPLKGAESRAWVLLDDRGLAQKLEDYIERLKKSSKQEIPIVPRLLTLNMLRARQFLNRHQLDTLADAFGQARIHIVIYGLGATGRAIVKEAAQFYVVRPSLAGKKLRVTFLDRDPAAREASLLAEDPGISTVIDLVGCQANLTAAGLLETQFCLLPADVTAHVIALGDAASAFNLAVSLRRWLLEPPVSIESVQPHHPGAPIFVRTPNWRGLGQLLCKRAGFLSAQSNKDGSVDASIPDGIFGWGAVEDLFGAADRGLAPAATLLDPDSERGATKFHAFYQSGRPKISGSSDLGEHRVAEREWAMLPSSLRESNFRAFDHVALKARAIGWRLVSYPSGPPHSRDIDANDAKFLAELEHRRYMAERLANGWRYAAQRMDAVRVHPDLVDWALLNKAEQQLDEQQIAALPKVVRAAKRRLAPALVIGVVGHRPNKARETDVKPQVAKQLRDLKHRKHQFELLMLTALAPGTDTWAAEAALELGIPFIAALPLPYELYREDFATVRALSNFHRLVAQAELYVELPLRFGRASEMTMSRQPAPRPNLERRNKQYALAGAYIVERAHELIAVYDGAKADGTGGTADVVDWWSGKTAMPAEYATPSTFFVRPAPEARAAAHIISPQSPDDTTGRHDAGHL